MKGKRNPSKLLMLTLICTPVLASDEDFPLHSAERSGTPQFKNCVANSEETAEEARCLQEEYNRQSALLELAFDELLVSSNAEQKIQILRAQNAWLTFREENCKVRMLNGGSGSPVFHYGCLARETITRRAEISELWDY